MLSQEPHLESHWPRTKLCKLWVTDGGVMRSLTTIRGFWMDNNQKTKDQPYNERISTFLTVCPFVFPHDSFGSEHTMRTLCTAHANECYLEHIVQTQDCQTLWPAASFLYVKHFWLFFKMMVWLWKTRTCSISQPSFLSMNQISPSLNCVIRKLALKKKKPSAWLMTWVSGGKIINWILT